MSASSAATVRGNVVWWKQYFATWGNYIWRMSHSGLSAWLDAYSNIERIHNKEPVLKKLDSFLPSYDFLRIFNCTHLMTRLLTLFFGLQVISIEGVLLTSEYISLRGGGVCLELEVWRGLAVASWSLVSTSVTTKSFNLPMDICNVLCCGNFVKSFSFWGSSLHMQTQRYRTGTLLINISRYHWRRQVHLSKGFTFIYVTICNIDNHLTALLVRSVLRTLGQSRWVISSRFSTQILSMSDTPWIIIYHWAWQLAVLIRGRQQARCSFIALAFNFVLDQNCLPSKADAI